MDLSCQFCGGSRQLGEGYIHAVNCPMREIPIPTTEGTVEDREMAVKVRQSASALNDVLSVVAVQGLRVELGTYDLQMFGRSVPELRVEVKKIWREQNL